MFAAFGKAGGFDALHVFVQDHADEFRRSDAPRLNLLLFKAAAADDDHRLEQLGTADQCRAARARSDRDIPDRGPLERAMLQMVAKLAEAVGGLARGVLHRVAHDRAIDIGRREGGHLAIEREQQSRRATG